MSNITLTDDTPVDPDDEMLVAYLDGELDPKAENELMNRLTADEQLNRRLRRLQEGWEWLDTLPGVASNEKLVESTLELVVADIVKTKPKTESALSKYRLAIGITSACLLGIAAAIAAVSIIKSNRYEKELGDLEIAQHLNAYLRGRDLALMRTLSADPSWTRMIAAAREIGDFGSVGDDSIAEIPVDQRIEFIRDLPLEKRVPLAERWERFQHLDEETEQQVRQTAEAVAAQPDPDTLVTTMELYSVWIETLSPELRDRIESEDPKIQRKAIAEAIAVTQEATIWRSRDQLSDEAVERIYFVLRKILQQRIDSGDEPTIKHVESVESWIGSLDFFGDDVDTEPFVIMGLVMGRDEDESFWRSRRGPGPPFGAGRTRRDRPAPLTDEELEIIRSILPNEALDTLELVSSSFNVNEALMLRSLTLRGWAEEATRRKMPRRPESSLLERYNELTPAERERIDLMPPKIMLERIEREFRPRWSNR
jgi:hypothetical protein